MTDVIKKYYILFIIFALILFVSLSRIQYCLFGDLSIYYSDYLKLKTGYFIDNFNALFNGSAQHIKLTTEGGWTFLLYLFSFLHLEFPYFLAAVLFAFVVLVTSIIIILSTKNYKTAICGILIMFFCINISTGIRQSVWMITNPYRDCCSYLLALISIMFALSVLKNIGTDKEYKNSKSLFLCGMFLGLSTWFRIPNIILAIPVGSVFIFHFLKNYKIQYCCKAAIIFVAAVLIGLIPIITQCYFEGKLIHEAGQANLLVHNPVPLPQHRNLNPSKEEIFALSENNVVCGLHLQNFKYTFPKTLKMLIKKVYGYKLFYVYMLFIMVAIFKNTKNTFLLFFCSIAMLIFYSFYDKFVDRYYVLHILFFMMAFALGFIAFLDVLIKLFGKVNTSNIVRAIQVVLFILFMFSLKYSYGSYKRIFQERQFMVDYKENLGKYVDKCDIVYNTPFKFWTEESITDEVEYWSWSGSDRAQNYAEFSAKLLEQLNYKFDNGNKAFVFQPTKENEICPNWKINDISLFYDLVFVTNIFSLDRYDMSLFQIKQKEKKQFKTTFKPLKNLILWCEDGNRKSVFPVDVEIQMEEFSTNVILNAGFNIFPDIGFSTNIFKELVINCRTNLPGIIIADVFNNEVAFDFRDYVIAPIFNRTFENSYVEWRGDPHWRRDSMFLKNRGKKRELFSSILINRKSDISFTKFIDNYQPLINFYVSCENMKDISADMFNDLFVFEINGKRIVPSVVVDKHKKSKTYYDLSFSSPKYSKESAGLFVISIIPTTEKSLSIYKLTISQ
jgi:hypothetical protein